MPNLSGTVNRLAAIYPVMNLEERLVDLCESDKRAQARSLAQAALANEPVEAVVSDDDVVRIETPNFRGVHRLRTDRGGAVDVVTAGEYTFESDLVSLSFSTTGVTPRAYDRVQEVVARLNDEDPSASSDDDEPVSAGESTPVDVDPDQGSPDPPARFRAGLLKGLF